MSSDDGEPSRERAATALQRAVGSLSTGAMTRMQSEMGWFRDLAAEERSWVGLIVQAGIKNFVDWYLHESHAPGELRRSPRRSSARPPGR